MYSVSGIPTGYILLSIIGITVLVVGGFSLIVAWNPSFLQDIYVYKRFIAFLHPFKTAANEGAQLVNSYYAIHNGGLFGLGLGNSIQKRGYLPEPYTDFILSIIAEEVGSLGALVVLGLLFYLVILIMERGVKAQSQYSTLICFGVTAIIFFQTLFNVGAVLGLMPITGVTLPFISYGGSSLWVLSAAIGLVLNVTAEEKKSDRRCKQRMSINQELADQEIASRTSLIVYLRNVNDDQFKLRRFGDIVYFSKKLHYLILYVNQAEAEETASKLRTFSFVKKVEFSQNDALDLDNQKIEQQISDMAKEAEEKLNQTDKEDWIK